MSASAAASATPVGPPPAAPSTTRPARPRLRGTPGRSVPPLTAVAASLVVATVLTALAGCGGATGSTSAPDDAKAGCAALSRTKNNLLKPTVVDLKRLSAAANLGTAAALENKKYAVLAGPMNSVLADIQASDTAKLATDVRAALSVCSDLKLPH
jgi:hypothetical protein